MTVRDLVRPLPGVRRVSLLRQRIAFTGSASFWEKNYSDGNTSGDGSYGTLAQGKAEFLNNFVEERNIQSVLEFGCGDGNQLSLAHYPRYIGLDVSRSAIGLCKRRFADDKTKSFFIYDGDCFVDRAGLFTADLVLSLDVIYHLIEDAVFESYMTQIFSSARRYVVVYSTNMMMADTAPHVRHRLFCSWVEHNCPDWMRTQVVRGPNSGQCRADFFIYERRGGAAT
jgi:cyclopropane fatty-acyl-phospholipid synthase-like methyltransferase